MFARIAVHDGDGQVILGANEGMLTAGMIYEVSPSGEVPGEFILRPVGESALNGTGQWGESQTVQKTSSLLMTLQELGVALGVVPA